MSNGATLNKFKRSKPTTVTSNPSQPVSGCETLLIYGLRHSRAVMTHLETNDLKAVKDKLGHRDIKMSDRYADIDENLKQLHFPSSNQLSIEIEKLKKSLYDGTIKTKN